MHSSLADHANIFEIPRSITMPTSGDERKMRYVFGQFGKQTSIDVDDYAMAWVGNNDLRLLYGGIQRAVRQSAHEAGAQKAPIAALTGNSLRLGTASSVSEDLYPKELYAVNTAHQGSHGLEFKIRMAHAATAEENTVLGIDTSTGLSVPRRFTKPTVPSLVLEACHWTDAEAGTVVASRQVFVETVAIGHNAVTQLIAAQPNAEQVMLAAEQYFELLAS